jgi:hypothetical protein
VPRGSLLHRWGGGQPPARVDSYVPDGCRGINEVEADDARVGRGAAGASEVDAGRFELPATSSAVLLREGMTVDEYRQANRGLTVQFLWSFAAFLQKSRFKFGWEN